MIMEMNRTEMQIQGNGVQQKNKNKDKNKKNKYIKIYKKKERLFCRKEFLFPPGIMNIQS